MHISFWCQDLAEAVSADELARYLDLKKLDERAYTFEGVSAYDGWVYSLWLSIPCYYKVMVYSLTPQKRNDWQTKIWNQGTILDNDVALGI